MKGKPDIMRKTPIMNSRSLVHAFILAGVILGLLSTPMNASPDKPNEPDVSWRQLLHRGLGMYWRKQYKDVFVLLEKSVRHDQPGPGVHQVLGLMRKAFVKCRDPRQGNKDWNTFALAYVKNLTGKPKLIDTDLVLLSLTKESTDRTANETVLDKFVVEFPRSPWYDWAFWEKAQAVGSRAWVGSNPLGVAALQGNKSKVGCLVMNAPELWIRGRAAKAFLRSHRDSYMAERMREDLAIWRMTLALQALGVLEQNKWYVGSKTGSAFPFMKRQIEAIARAKADVRSVETMLPKVAKIKLKASRMLHEFLWESDERWKIVDYFEYITKIPDEKGYILQKEILEWVAPLLEQRKKQKAQWHEWKPTPTTRPAAKPQQNTGKP